MADRQHAAASDRRHDSWHIHGGQATRCCIWLRTLASVLKLSRTSFWGEASRHWYTTLLLYYTYTLVLLYLEIRTTLLHICPLLSCFEIVEDLLHDTGEERMHTILLHVCVLLSKSTRVLFYVYHFTCLKIRGPPPSHWRGKHLYIFFLLYFFCPLHLCVNWYYCKCILL